MSLDACNMTLVYLSAGVLGIVNCSCLFSNWHITRVTRIGVRLVGNLTI